VGAGLNRGILTRPRASQQASQVSGVECTVSLPRAADAGVALRLQPACGLLKARQEAPE